MPDILEKIDHGKATQSDLKRQSEFYRAREDEPNHFTENDEYPEEVE